MLCRALCLLIFTVFSSLSVYCAAGEKPNVLFIICDDLNCDIGSYGDSTVKTPNLDKLAARGVLFENAHCQFAHCGPSRASFMTSLYPDQTRIRGNNILIRKHTPDVVTMSELFKNNGYIATRIGKIYHYNVPKAIGTNGHDDPASWTEVINPRGRDKTDEGLVKTLKKGQYGATLSWLAAEGEDAEQTDGIAATEAILQLEERAKDKKPFFLAVGLYRPHTPFVAPKRYFDMHSWEDINVPRVPRGYYKTIPKGAVSSIRDKKKKEQHHLKPEVARAVIQAYHASISFADAQIGRILDALDSTGLAENTIVVFTSDHGYHMGEHGHWQKRTLYNQATRVPLIISAPEYSKNPSRVKTPAELVDIYPTLANLAGLKAPSYLQGVSLESALEDPEANPRESALSQLDKSYSIRTKRYRYSKWFGGGDGNIELYDHKNDPEEMKNLATDPAYAKVRIELAAMLEKRIESAQKQPEGVEIK